MSQVNPDDAVSGTHLATNLSHEIWFFLQICSLGRDRITFCESSQAIFAPQDWSVRPTESQRNQTMPPKGRWWKHIMQIGSKLPMLSTWMSSQCTLVARWWLRALLSWHSFGKSLYHWLQMDRRTWMSNFDLQNDAWTPASDFPSQTSSTLHSAWFKLAFSSHAVEQWWRPSWLMVLLTPTGSIVTSLSGRRCHHCSLRARKYSCKWHWQPQVPASAHIWPWRTKANTKSESNHMIIWCEDRLKFPYYWDVQSYGLTIQFQSVGLTVESSKRV